MTLIVSYSHAHDYFTRHNEISSAVEYAESWSVANPGKVIPSIIISQDGSIQNADYGNPPESDSGHVISVKGTSQGKYLVKNFVSKRFQGVDNSSGLLMQYDSETKAYTTTN